MQLIAKGLDYSAGVISARTIKNASYDFVIRYVGFPGNRKCITPEEYKDLTSNGIRVYAVYEYTTNDAMGGLQGGVNAAKAARADMDRIGFPANAICFFCADRHLANSEVPIAQQYINGAASVFGWDKTGAYGFQEFIWAIQEDNNCKYLWQCGSQSFVREGVHFYQWNNGSDVVGGITCDINMQFIPVTGGSASGGSIERRKEIMAGMAKGNDPNRDQIYMITLTPEGMFKRHIKGMEEVLFWQKQGMTVETVEQAWVDSIWDDVESIEVATKNQLGVVEVKIDAGFGQLLDDEVKIINAVRNMPTGAQVDIKAFVEALVPALGPALPQSITQKQVRDALVEVLGKTKFNVSE